MISIPVHSMHMHDRPGLVYWRDMLPLLLLLLPVLAVSFTVPAYPVARTLAAGKRKFDTGVSVQSADKAVFAFSHSGSENIRAFLPAGG